jgi:hypothetical protein
LFEKYDKEAIPIVATDNEVCGIVEKITLDHYLHARILELHRKIEKLG